MGKSQFCDAERLILYLLADCCDDELLSCSPQVPQALKDRMSVCEEEAGKIANLPEVHERFQEYKVSSTVRETDMYAPLSRLLNLVLGKLSEVDVSGLPKFREHIVCVPMDEAVASTRSQEDSEFKPDIAIPTMEIACTFHKINRTPDLMPSQFIEMILKKRSKKESKPPKGPRLFWKDVLSVIKVKRNKDEEWSEPAGHNETDGGPSHGPPTPPDSSRSETLTTLMPGKSEGCPALGIEPPEESKGRSAPDTGFSSGPPKQSKKQKQTPRQPRASELDQTGTYAGKKLSDSHSTGHTINPIIRNDSVWICWIDREGPVVSTSFKFFEKPIPLFVLFLIFQRFGCRQWGEISELASDGHISLHPMNKDGTVSNELKSLHYYPDDVIHSASWCILGRATEVLAASEGGCAPVKKEPANAQGGVAHDASRIEGFGSSSEARDDYRRAHDDRIKTRSLVLKISWPEESRVPEWKIIASAQALGKDNVFIKDHIPEVKYTRDLEQYSTRRIRKFLSLPRTGKTGTRILRLIAMPRLRPLLELEGEELWDALWQIFECHYQLWTVGIYHGDISPRNLMYSYSSSGKVCGVSNDFDLATSKDIPANNTVRTGTIPFLPLALLSDKHDLPVFRLYRWRTIAPP